MYPTIIFYSCPTCGKPDSSYGLRSCDECEDKRLKAAEEERARIKEQKQPCQMEGCEAYAHCYNCGDCVWNYELSQRRTCDDCFFA